MVDSGFRWIAAAGESFDSVAMNVYGYERYAAEILNMNPNYSSLMTFAGGEVLILPSIAVIENGPGYTPAVAPWKE